MSGREIVDEDDDLEALRERVGLVTSMKKYILIDYVGTGVGRVVIAAKRGLAEHDVTIMKVIQNKGKWQDGDVTFITPSINTVTFESDDLQEVIDMGVMGLL